MTDAAYLTPALYVDGEWITRTAHMQPVENPASCDIIAKLPQADEAMIDRALTAAGRAFGPWRRTAPAERARIMTEAAAILRRNAKQAARDLTLDQGKPLAEARTEIENCALLLEYCPQEVARVRDRPMPERDGFRSLGVRYEPIGPVAALSPWNFPASIATRKLASAIAAGCPVIVRPADETPSGVAHVIRALDQAGLPPGVIGLLYGDPALIAARLIESPVIRKLAFTGSTRVGCELGQLAGKQAKPAVMELGGHAPVIVCADADVERAVTLSVQSKYRNAGQVCISPTRWYIHENLFDRFCSDFVTQASALTIGDGLDPEVRMGPLNNARGIAHVDRLVRDAVAKGARLLTGGRRLERPGYFYAPTVLCDVPPEADIMRIEPFGPVAVLNRFDDMETALSKANGLPYALGAYAFTASTETAEEIAQGLDAGMVGINTFSITLPDSPIGGRRFSGYGSEGGPEGISAYFIPKFTAMA